MKTHNFGALNEHAVGIIMKEWVRRVTSLIRHKRFSFKAKAKKSYAGKMDDIVTTIDPLAEKMYKRLIGETFPGYGIIGEESKKAVACRLPGGVIAYFTVDPLDGTKAANRKQSHGIGTMVALVYNGEVVAAYVGDVMTEEIYGYRPGSGKVHRISQYEHSEDLVIDENLKLRDQYLLLRKPPDSCSPLIRTAVAGPERGGLFKDIEITGGSIGVSMARLWKGEVGAALLSPGYETPWDSTPVIGISQKLGFVFLKITAQGTLERIVLKPAREVIRRDSELLVIHKSKLPEIRRWRANRSLAVRDSWIA